MNDSYYTEWPCFSSEASRIGYSHILDARLDCSDPWEQMFSSFTHLTLASHTNLLYNTISSHFIGFGMIADIKPSGLLLFSYENMPLEYIFIGLLFISFHPFKGLQHHCIWNFCHFTEQLFCFLPILFQIYSPSAQ